MMYFKNLPNIRYQFPDDVIRDFNNLSVFASVVEEYIDGSSDLEQYFIAEGDTPEIIAFDRYDDVSMHWVILLVNEITNLYTQWPMESSQFSQYLIDKYQEQEDSDGNLVVMSDTETSEFIEFEGLPSTQYQSTNSANVRMRPHHFIDSSKNIYSYHTAVGEAVDANGRLIIQPTFVPVSIYDYENALNEAKRAIEVPNNDTALQIKRELSKVFNG